MALYYNTYTGNNSTVDYAFTFPYLKTSDIKVSLDGVDKTLTTHYTLHNATTIRFGTAPGTGVAVKIYRNTDSSTLAATFYPGSAIRSGDLNDNFTQNLYVTQETEGTVDEANATSTTAKTTADNAKLATDRLVGTTSNNGTTWTVTGNNTNASTDPKGLGYAITTADTAKSTADTASNTATTASNNATTAKTAVDTYVHDGSSLQGDGQGGNPQGVKYAVDQAAAANTTAASANSTANAASSTATTANTAANNATSTANSATTTANNASTTATTANTNATNAKLATDRLVATTSDGGSTWTLAGNNTNASTDPKGVGYAITQAEAAVSTANSASASVADAVLYNDVANKAALEALAPSANGYYEVQDTSNLANGTWTLSGVTYTLANIPGTFQGALYLGMKLSYTHSNKTYTYMKYHASDPENRYIANTRPFGGTTTFTVKVATKNSFHRYNGTGASNGFTIDGEQAPFLTFTPGRTYKFDQADSSNSGHPLVFYEEADKTTSYSTNITTNGTPGSAGAYTQIVTSDNLPTILHYQCSSHAYMGNAVQCNTAFDRTALAIIDGGNFDSSSSTASMTNSYDGGNFDS